MKNGKKYNKIQTILINLFSKVGVFLIKKEDWFTIPNILSYLRIAMLPLYVYLYFNAEVVTDYYQAALVIVLSGLTDFLDGIIARNTGQITDLGKVLDPIADKLTQIVVVGAMALKRPYIMPLLILFIVKELYLLINNLILYKKDIMMDGAMWFGKIATAVFYICMFILIIFPYLSKSKSLPLIYITAVFQIISFCGYARWFLNVFRKGNKISENG